MVKRCFVPHCSNTSELHPKKAFILIPRDEKLRAKWFESVGIPIYSRATNCHCCEDHFVLINDAVNYIRHKYLGGIVKLKEDVVPHKKIPKQVCRLCLKLLNNEDKIISLNESKNHLMKETIQVCLPEIDLSVTKDPATCYECFKKIETFYDLKKTALSTEMKIVTQIKGKVKYLPQIEKLKNNFEFDLFKHYKAVVNSTEKKLKPKKHKLDESSYCEEVKPEKVIKLNTVDDDNKDNNIDAVSINNDLITIHNTELQNINFINTPLTLIKSEDTILTLESKEDLTPKTILYNNEVCEVLYITGDNTEFDENNVLEFIQRDNTTTTEITTTTLDSNCLFCGDYFGDDILDHVITHYGNNIKCNMCDFNCENANESDIHQHIYVHSDIAQ